MEYVIFGDEKYSDNHPGEKADVVKSLKYATYFCIDQFNYSKNDKNNKDDEKLAFLKGRHVPNLPNSVSDDINYTDSGSHHRYYTHRGWNHQYTKEQLTKSHWNTRKQLLINTVKKEFDPGFFNSVLSVFGNDKALAVTEHFDSKCEKFAELLYYIHILGDHIYDYEKLKKSGSTDDQPYTVKDMIIYIGGSRDDATVIHDLKECIDTLFSDNDRARLMKEKLDRIEKEIDKIRYEEGRIGGLNTVGRYKKYAKFAQDILDVLHKYIPDLLKNEAFFSRVFTD